MKSGDIHESGQQTGSGVRAGWLVPLCVTAVWWLQYYGVPEAPVFYDDARSHLYWRVILQDPSLFPDDLFVHRIRHYFSGGIFDAIYSGLLSFFSLAMSAQIVATTLFLATVTFFNRILADYGIGMWGRLLACAMLLLFRNDIAIAVQRSFFLPLLMLAWLAWLRQSLLVYAVIAVQAMLYPVTFVSTLCFVGCMELFRAAEMRSPLQFVKRIAPYAAVALIMGGAVKWLKSRADSEGCGGWIDVETARAMVEFGPLGRDAFWGDSFFTTYIAGAGRADLRLDLCIPLLVLAGISLVLSRGRLVRRLELVALLGSSLGLFVLAHVVLFKLYLPTRYVAWTLPLSLILLTIFGLEQFRHIDFSRFIGGRLIVLRHLFSSQKRVTQLMLVAVFIIISVNQVYKPIRMDADMQRFMAFARTTGKGVLFAGHPRTMSNVPLFAQRKVLISSEYVHAWTDCYPVNYERMKDMLLMYFSPDAQEVRALAEKWGVDYFVMEEGRYAPGGGIKYEPWRGIVKKIQARGESILRRGGVGREVFASGGVWVYAMEARE